MAGQPLSVLEVSQIIEQGLLPHRCRCTSRDGTSLDLHLTAADPPHRTVSITGVPLAELNSSRALSRLVLELRDALIPEAQSNDTVANRNMG